VSLLKLVRARPGVSAPAGTGRHRRGPIAVLVACALAAGAVAAYLISRGRPAPAATTAPVATARVTQGTLTSQEQENGTVEYAHSYTIVAPSSGVYTALPTAGQVVRQGQALYGLSGQPVVLLYGDTPAYRTLFAGMRGPDVAELNADLVALGYAARQNIPPGSDTYTSATAVALDRLQAAAGLPQSSDLPLGQAVFLPGAVAVSSVNPGIGTAAAAGQTVMQVTSTKLQVAVQIDAAQQSLVHLGDVATITLPDGGTTAGKVVRVAQLASTPASSSGATGNQPSTASTVEVDVAPDQASVLQGLTDAVLDVAITTASVRNALAVPVTALLAQASGGYAVEVVQPNGTHQLVPVQLGIFDDGAGLVQVSGAGLKAGEQVVVAGT
jgi:hypothetical protein